MPTNEERREVANNLRETSDAISDWGDSNPYWYVMKCVYGDVEIHNDNELLYRLADLIEPEPERTITPVLDKSSWYIWRCPECGQPINRADNYCSSCGVKVTPTPL